ncbi:MAG: DUF4417 domain-containing protein [Bacilli bacterium]|nr:DUF4417 domain-containing protein [Bacilli bacterium]
MSDNQKRRYAVRKSFRDIFGVWLLEELTFEGDYDMPVVGNFDDISTIDYLALYSDVAEYSKTENAAVGFYQYDHVFDGIHGLYNSIIYKDEKRLAAFRERFKGVKWIITPDYSLFGDFPNALQIYNVYRSRICAAWLESNTGAKVIPNVRWSFPFTFEYCFDGIMKGSNVAIGVLGLVKGNNNRAMFLKGFRKMVDTIQPKAILVYGFVTESNIEELLGYAMERSVRIVIPHSKIDRYKREEAVYGVR